MKTFVTIADSPVGYTTPSFPSLYWPVGNDNYSAAMLYYASDIWRFTFFWTLIFFVGFYTAAGAWASFVHRRVVGSFWIMFVYLLVGALQGTISGTVFGFVTAAVYKSGLFSMSTWVPMCSGVVQILFNVVTSYPMMSFIL